MLNVIKNLLTANHVTKAYLGIWIITVLYALYGLFPNTNHVVQTAVIFVSAIITAVFIFRDANELKANGLNHPSKWWVLFGVVYMVRRDRAVGAPNRYLSLAFICVLVLSAVVQFSVMTPVNTKLLYAEAGCGIINDMPEIKTAGLVCLKVTDLDHVKGEFYFAKVLMSDSRVYPISLEGKGDMLYVNFLNN